MAKGKIAKAKVNAGTTTKLVNVANTLSNKTGKNIVSKLRGSERYRALKTISKNQTTLGQSIVGAARDSIIGATAQKGVVTMQANKLAAQRRTDQNKQYADQLQEILKTMYGNGGQSGPSSGADKSTTEDSGLNG